MSREDDIKNKMKGKTRRSAHEILMSDDSNIDNENNNNKNSRLDEIRSKRQKSQTHTFKGFYFENEVANAFDRLTENDPKGVKSEIMNRLLKDFLKDEGAL